MWALLGTALSLALGLTALLRSLAPRSTYYEGEVYGMTPAAHRRYALFFGVLTVYFLADLGLRGKGLGGPVEAAALAVLALGAILYGATFLRGAAGEEE